MQCHRSGFLIFVILAIVPSLSYGDWFYFSGTGHYYGLTDARLTWAEAETQAVAMGGHLASILTQEEQDFLVTTFVNPASPGGERQPFWICGTDQADEGTFVWTTGEPFFYTNWRAGEPNNNGGNEDFVAFNFHYGVNQSNVKGTWNDTTNVGSVNGPYRGIIELNGPPPPPVVFPDSFLVTRGTYVAGGVVELSQSDDADLSIRRAVSDTQSRTEFEIKGICPVAMPRSLEVTLEGSVFARSDVNQIIELFNYSAFPAGAWEQVDTRTANRFTDSTVTVAATGDLSRFVAFGTMCIEARVRYQSLSSRQQFSSNTDLFIWTIGQ